MCVCAFIHHCFTLTLTVGTPVQDILQAAAPEVALSVLEPSPSSFSINSIRHQADLLRLPAALPLPKPLLSQSQQHILLEAGSPTVMGLAAGSKPDSSRAPQSLIFCGLRVRMGLASGEPEVACEGLDYLHKCTPRMRPCVCVHLCSWVSVM